ncbi:MULTISPECIES: GNAT family N-acetyltransferase [unclassified Sporolactobacillus]|uniref:GNAT family N-acetyltransferase n=1 Tax=unclassified Sporolactobacillus TaxID=2628533 RepID=UPI00236773C6|nr:GNAT family N-acetyltransferase [Sporolactobacillus sp. CQH2019]MDD9146989.1 GNAT family N-acetyltransferase [Sporolactobacillus sp. CQH2019]
MITRLQIAEVSDAAFIHEIMIQAFIEYKQTAAPSSALEESVSSVSDALKDGEQALIAFDDRDEAAGMVRFRLKETAVYFFRLSVVPEKRGCGIAKRLLKALEDYAGQNNKYELICRVREKAAKNLNLYRSLGYSIFDREVVYKPNGVQIAVVFMRKRLERQV